MTAPNLTAVENCLVAMTPASVHAAEEALSELRIQLASGDGVRYEDLAPAIERISRLAQSAFELWAQVGSVGYGPVREH